MRLSKLELSGFKSFANPTVITLPEKIVAIVGPNGCGKSNISDALRWVLGVQSAKLLRGKKMDDLIFNGSGSRKPVGMAQVSLTMENGNGGVKFPGLENCPEVTVSRRIYRDAETEYLINKSACRLRDITDLFLDMGISANILTVIEQGQIELLINAKPVDRRYIIEEAAGIAKFKDRKETALRKLMHTEEDLLRVRDIMSEVKRQLNSLSRQAKKAERYKRYREEASEVHLTILFAEYQGLAQHLSRLSSEYREAQNKHEAVSSAHRAAEARLEALRLSLAQSRNETDRLSQEVHHLEKEALRTEADIQASAASATALLSEEERLAAEIAELSEKRSSLSGAVEDKRREERALAEEETQKSGLFQILKRELDELTGEHHSTIGKIEEERSAYIDLLSSISRERNIVTAGETHRQNLSRRESRIAEEKGAAVTALKEFEVQKEEQKEHLQELRSRIAAIEERKGALTAQTGEMKDALAHAQEEVSSLKEEHSRQSARINSLEELLNSYEGYRDGVKTILTWKGNGGGSAGIRGIVADLLETSPRYETAIEAVLGERLQYLVTNDQSHSLRALEYLKSSAGGRGTLIPVNPRADARVAATLPNGPGVIGPATSLIKCPQEYSGVFDYLLGEALVVEDLKTALDLWSGDSVRRVMVTLDGEVIDAGGAVTGGAPLDSNGSILHRKRLLREMKQEREELDSSLAAATARRDECLSRYETFKQELEQADAGLKEEEVARINCSKDLDLIANELQRGDVKLQATEYEEQELLREKNNHLQEVERARTELNRLSEEKLSLEARINELRGRVEGLQSHVEELKGKVIREEVQLTSRREKHTQCLSEIENLLGIGDEVNQKLQQKEEKREETIRNRAKEEATARELKVKLAELETERQERSNALVAKQEAHGEAESVLSSQEAELKTLRATMDDSREQLHALSLQEAEFKIQMGNLLETARHKYGADLSEESRELPDDMENCKEKLAQLNQILEGMGDVNMSALSEYEEVKERHDFLIAQHDDLVQSVEDLRQAIEKINRTTRACFREAYQRINANFKDMFHRLFGGGEAELVLTDESNLLETGVDIVARPPGKRLQNITLLSSGEKALSSLALLFAVFLSKPSPFCLLDEVDAPLDEPNVERFTEVLKTLAPETQFIIITHNKRTMAAADLLYGITMEEEGVSKVLSLRLEEASATV